MTKASPTWSLPSDPTGLRGEQRPQSRLGDDDTGRVLHVERAFLARSTVHCWTHSCLTSESHARIPIRPGNRLIQGPSLTKSK